MKVAVKNLENKKVREIELPDAVFGYPYKEHLIHSAVLSYQAAQRSGTHKTKTRKEVAGSGRKLWRQKGTGRARIGGIRSPLIAWGPGLIGADQAGSVNRSSVFAAIDLVPEIRSEDREAARFEGRYSAFFE